MKRLIKTLCLLLLIIITTACKTSVKSQKSEKISLFNGKDLSGWTIHGTEKWYVENQKEIQL